MSLQFAVFIGCFSVSYLLAGLIICSIPIATLDRFDKALTLRAKLKFKSCCRIANGFYNPLKACGKGILALLLRLKLLAMNNEVEPVGDKAAHQCAQQGTNGTRSK